VAVSNRRKKVNSRIAGGRDTASFPSPAANVVEQTPDENLTQHGGGIHVVTYLMTAAALKAFSATRLTRTFYRKLGNTVGANKRVKAGLPRLYVDRAKNILTQCKKHDLIRPGGRLLELGTGWAQWESTVLRLFHDVEITLFDVWDNRQLPACKKYMEDFGEVVRSEFGLSEAERTRVLSLLDSINKAQSFEELYTLLGFTYVVNPSGSLSVFPDNSFDLVFSCSVLEHVDRNILPDFVKDQYRVLKPGGHIVHLIDLGDHLAYYTKGTSYKNYLRYSDTMWRLLFENQVQYFNRVQRPEWLGLFGDAGFEAVENIAEPIHLNGLNVNPRFMHLTREDLECMTMKVIYRKPAKS
jgi:hypothetical protein